MRESQGRSGDRRLLGKVLEVLPRSLFRVETDDGRLVLSHVALSVRSAVGRILEGDLVTVELSEYDPKRGRIVQHRPGAPR